MSGIKTAVFPVAGLGTRFLPATKANPKEMLPIVDKPLIQYAAEEAVEAGAEVLVFITGRNKRSIADHFDRAGELESKLEELGKKDLLKAAQNIVPDHVQCIYIRQPDALGLGHAVLCAEKVVNNEPFFVVLADDLIINNGANCLEQMRDAYGEQQASIVGVQQIERQDASKYGVIEPIAAKATSPIEIKGIVEKPEPDKAPSNLGVVGRYVLTAGIFEQLKNIGKGAGGEIQLTDAIAGLLQKEKVYALQFAGKRYDCGDKLGYLQATVELAMLHPELGKQFSEYLKTLQNK